MGQRQALLLATFLTTFGLVLIGAVAMRLTSNPTTTTDTIVQSDGATAPLESTDSTTATVISPDQQAVDDLVASRESAYEQALSQANSQLQAANEQLAQLQGGFVGTSPAPVAGADAPTFAISAEASEQIARTTAPNATITAAPLLVDLQGTVAYEIATNAGLIYVDANSGAVLFNGASPAPAAPVAPAVQAAPPTAPVVPAPTTAPIPTTAPAAPAPSSTISEADALAIATNAVGAGTVDKIKLEEEHGILIWDVKFTNDNEVRIDAHTGAIVRTRIENDTD